MRIQAGGEGGSDRRLHKPPRGRLLHQERPARPAGKRTQRIRRCGFAALARVPAVGRRNHRRARGDRRRRKVR